LRGWANSPLPPIRSIRGCGGGLDYATPPELPRIIAGGAARLEANLAHSLRFRHLPHGDVR